MFNYQVAIDTKQNKKKRNKTKSTMTRLESAATNEKNNSHCRKVFSRNRAESNLLRAIAIVLQSQISSNCEIKEKKKK